MTDWKGIEVQITIHKHWADEPIYRTVLLDTDTMSDLFKEFSPLEYSFEIDPLFYDEGSDEWVV